MTDHIEACGRPTALFNVSCLAGDISHPAESSSRPGDTRVRVLSAATPACRQYHTIKSPPVIEGTKNTPRHYPQRPAAAWAGIWDARNDLLSCLRERPRRQPIIGPQLVNGQRTTRGVGSVSTASIIFNSSSRRDSPAAAALQVHWTKTDRRRL